MQFIIELDGSIQWHKMPIRFCKGIFLEKFQFGAISKTFCLQKKVMRGQQINFNHAYWQYVLVCYKSMEKYRYMKWGGIPRADGPFAGS